MSFVLPALCLCQVAACARITRAFISMWSASSASDFCATAITWVNQTFIEQALQIRRIDFLPFALDVWCMWPTNIRSLVPIQSKPAQVEEHAFTGSRTHSGSIKIFYS